jgi:hypothetical protein
VGGLKRVGGGTLRVRRTGTRLLRSSIYLQEFVLRDKENG